MIEAGVLIGVDGHPLYWHLPEDRTVASLPDSRTLWDRIWENRDRVLGFAHSHPGRGIPRPSWTDLTTFAGVEQGLGKRLNWWITSEDFWIHLGYRGTDKYDYASTLLDGDYQEPYWVKTLRDHSGYYPIT